MDFIFDATNICITLSKPNPTSLLPLFQTMLPLLRQDYRCLCFFDEGTYFKESFDTWLYEQITSGVMGSRPIIAEETFISVPKLNKKEQKQVADDQIIYHALKKHRSAKVLSFDKYADPQFVSKYGWSEREAYERVLTIYPYQDKIQLIRGEDEKVMELAHPGNNLRDLALETLNLIEQKEGRLIGKIKDLSAKKQLGKIKRRYTDMGPIHFTPGNHDSSFNFAESRGQEVHFQLHIHENRSKTGYKTFFINAKQVTPVGSIEIENQILREENERLNKEIELLKAKLEKLSFNHQNTAGELHTEKKINGNLYLHIGVLEEEVKALSEKLAATNTQPVISGDAEELQEKLDELNKDYDYLLDQYNRQKVHLHLIRKANNGTEDISKTFDLLRQELASIKAENAELKALFHKNPDPSNGIPETPPDLNIDSAPLLDWWYSLSKDWRDAFSNRNSMIPEDPDLVALQRILNAQEVILFGNNPFLPSLPFKLRDLSGLKELKKVQVINLSFNAISDLQEISHLENLHKVLLIENQSLTSLKGLEVLPHLSYLDLSGTKVSQDEIAWLETHAVSRSLEVVC